ncbi:hypothetical protein G6M78_08285 [Agrobacterium tumefaciens]|uniref:hypothetical protein n=1 Tax=Agrobacterium tumefaciens TaxID=358 RepID=UPI001573970C|nr:hypothetical protein [Agrobacterium tumefaciens]NTE55077.1 hypothetical protein [Agrobacterium tumefaciens]NTE73845.1 hypothetical protein [Agrobacterium tumefaciens]
MTTPDYQSAVTAHLDGLATSKGYADAADAISYANSEVSEFEWHAKSLIRHRDAARKALMRTLADIDAGGIAPPVEALIAGLPEFRWL